MCKQDFFGKTHFQCDFSIGNDGSVQSITNNPSMDPRAQTVPAHDTDLVGTHAPAEVHIPVGTLTSSQRTLWMTK